LLLFPPSSQGFSILKTLFPHSSTLSNVKKIQASVSLSNSYSFPAASEVAR
jgi:hypothetical protein